MPEPDPISQGDNEAEKGSRYDSTDSYVARWRNYCNILLGRLGEEDTRRFLVQQEDDRWPSECKTCEENKKFLWSYSMCDGS